MDRTGKELLADPIVDVVSILPKDQLAEMAEARAEEERQGRLQGQARVRELEAELARRDENS